MPDSESQAKSKSVNNINFLKKVWKKQHLKGMWQEGNSYLTVCNIIIPMVLLLW